MAGGTCFYVTENSLGEYLYKKIMYIIMSHGRFYFAKTKDSGS